MENRRKEGQKWPKKQGPGRFSRTAILLAVLLAILAALVFGSKEPPVKETALPWLKR